MAVFVYPRRPSATILDFNELQIAADPENPSLEPNMVTWSGSDAPFARYSPLHYTVALQLGFGVTQGHQKQHYSIEHTSLYSSSIINMALSITVSEILIENRYPLVFGAPLG